MTESGGIWVCWHSVAAMPIGGLEDILLHDVCIGVALDDLGQRAVLNVSVGLRSNP